MRAGPRAARMNFYTIQGLVPVSGQRTSAAVEPQLVGSWFRIAFTSAFKLGRRFSTVSQTMDGLMRN